MQLKDEWFRPAAYYLVKTKGFTRKRVAELFGVSRKRVERVVKRFDETGNHKDRTGRGRKRTALSEQNIRTVKGFLRANNHTKLRNSMAGSSTRKIALKLAQETGVEVSQVSVWQILRKVLKLKPWKKKKGQKLTTEQKRKRLNRVRSLKQRFADRKHRQVLWSDECYFPIEEGHNSQNDRIWAAEKPPDEERIVERQMKPKGVMVWAGVGYDAKAPLIFVEAGVKINTDVYRQKVLKPVKRWAMEHYGVDEEGCWNEWTFQQDGAPSHTSTRENPSKFRVPTQTWLEDHFPDFIKKDEWPPASPDLNPLDYCIWPLIKSDVNAQAHTSVESLKRAIIRAYDSLSQETINRAIDDWPRRLDAVIAATGGHFE